MAFFYIQHKKNNISSTTNGDPSWLQLQNTTIDINLLYRWLTAKTSDFLSIYLSIYTIYIAPLQGNYAEALPAQARAKGKVLRRL